jgi:hypothetical protein
MFSLGAKRLDKFPPSPNNAVKPALILCLRAYESFSHTFSNNLESYCWQIKDKGGRIDLGWSKTGVKVQ